MTSVANLALIVLVFRTGSKVPVVASESLHLSIEQVLFHFHPIAWTSKAGDLVQVGVLRNKVGNIWTDL